MGVLFMSVPEGNYLCLCPRVTVTARRVVERWLWKGIYSYIPLTTHYLGHMSAQPDRSTGRVYNTNYLWQSGKGLVIELDYLDRPYRPRNIVDERPNE